MIQFAECAMYTFLTIAALCLVLIAAFVRRAAAALDRIAAAQMLSAVDKVGTFKERELVRDACRRAFWRK